MEDVGFAWDPLLRMSRWVKDDTLTDGRYEGVESVYLSI